MHEYYPIPGLAVATKNFSSTFRHLGEEHAPVSLNAVVPHAVSEKFDAKGRTWIQLTPDGPLR